MVFNKHPQRWSEPAFASLENLLTVFARQILNVVLAINNATIYIINHIRSHLLTLNMVIFHMFKVLEAIDIWFTLSLAQD